MGTSALVKGGERAHKTVLKANQCGAEGAGILEDLV